MYGLLQILFFLIREEKLGGENRALPVVVPLFHLSPEQVGMAI
jgi:hypothetical protein